MSPKDVIIHFLLWLIAPLAVMYLYGAQFFPFIVIGGAALIFIEYQAFGAWGKAPFAIIGYLLAIAIAYYFLGLSLV
jgi:hypothetical protein